MIPIHKTTTVPLSPQEAFDLFMTDLDAWWPKDRHAFDPKAKLIVEPRKNGKIIEVAPDGKRTLWGRIIGWDPGHYMAFSWHPDGDEDAATVVAVSFKKTVEGCQLDLTHGGFDVLGDTADAVSTSYLLGWDLTLGSYCFAATKIRVMS
jgi:uncharacterized protein YndB with AHSA1/START domain